ncbi:hypothetical protein V1520DRAFT_296271 [Lipomyces starkeyi]|uniref:Secreted protein n=1 Tax=Lipomyces starkeyi NRRL Y-11557 TaxID=675824 RepID=A0A1E3PUN9_LIPST|nr:hypothetical protein LIPSTDRAFT_76337 [Lipomyces starkeyi NRRL Y-11557]
MLIILRGNKCLVVLCLALSKSCKRIVPSFAKMQSILQYRRIGRAIDKQSDREAEQGNSHHAHQGQIQSYIPSAWPKSKTGLDDDIAPVY